MTPETSNEDGGLKMSDVVTEQEDTIDRLVKENARLKEASVRMSEVKQYLEYQRWEQHTMEQFLDAEAENARLKKAIQTADPVELGKIKKELDDE